MSPSLAAAERKMPSLMPTQARGISRLAIPVISSAVPNSASVMQAVYRPIMKNMSSLERSLPTVKTAVLVRSRRYLLGVLGLLSGICFPPFLKISILSIYCTKSRPHSQGVGCKFSQTVG